MPKRITKKKNIESNEIINSEDIIKPTRTPKRKPALQKINDDNGESCSGLGCLNEIKCNTKKEPRKKQETAIDKIEDVIEDTIIAPGKYILYSKVIWANIIAFILFLIQQKYGFMFDVELQTEILIVVNMILRGFTKNELRLK